MERVAIIILNWNGLALTKACVTGLIQYQVPADIYILDNGSAQNEAPELKQHFPDVHIERSEVNLGFTGGNNYWITRLQDHYDYLVLLNQDTIVTGDFITPLLSLADSDQRLAAVGPTAGKISLWTGKVYTGQGDDVIIGYCCMMRTSVLKQIGALTEKYFAYYEEADWCWRAHLAGYRCQSVTITELQHLKSSPYRTYYNARNMVWFMKRFANPLQLTWFFCYYFSVFWIERLRKGSTLSDLWRAAKDGWL
ncbi:MAG: glycosyltransferase family 2 protein [Candidatus Kerfeldbacteria bacterium]|nr:glycosyltransferase family 2 protein [Candidatus Kerfeldbacteria bacterium]